MLKLASSNTTKLKEYKKMFPDIEGIKIPDLPEIKADKDSVILYKVKALNQDNVILEDTILEVWENDTWREIVDIKWQVKHIKGRFKARWVVSLGIKNHDIIKIFRGVINGQINPDLFIENTFGFDSMFFPEGETRTLLELNNLGIKSRFSARKMAIDHLKENRVYLEKNFNELPPWTGAMQTKS